MLWLVVFTLNARLQHDAQRSGLLLAKRGERIEGGAERRVNGRGTHMTMK
jgi:hypothetical protein